MKPLNQLFVDKYLSPASVYCQIVQICSTQQSYYLALTTGDIVRIQYPTISRLQSCEQDNIQESTQTI